MLDADEVAECLSLPGLGFRERRMGEAMLRVSPPPSSLSLSLSLSLSRSLAEEPCSGQPNDT
jgi:hypothetical protein